MMDELIQLISGYMTPELELAVASNAVSGAPMTKLKIRVSTVKNGLVFQATRTVGPKEIHENFDAEGATKCLAESMGAIFKQLELKNTEKSAVVMISKKGKVTIKEHRIKNNSMQSGAVKTLQPETGAADRQTNVNNVGPGIEIKPASHNRKKNYVLPEDEPVPFLVELGVMTKSGKVVAARYDKFRQINRYLEFVEDIIPSLPTGREISIIDFGCGKSYLTFALYYYLHEVKGFDVRITGLDLKADVIKNCNELAKKFGYEKLEFLHGDIADYTGRDSVDMVVTLHACDTATDYALYKAVKWGARVIFCVPCCQHELNKQIASDTFKDAFKYGLIKERMAALFTDSLRACILEEQGYRTQILEFIDMEHTPKNILIRAVRQPIRIKAGNSYMDMMNAIGAKPTLYTLLHEKEKEDTDKGGNRK